MRWRRKAREFIAKLGPQYLPASANEYVGKKQAQAQDAHEAILADERDVHAGFPIRKYLSDDEQYRLYKLIWQRFVASQMTPAVFDQTTVDIVAQAKLSYDFRVTGSVLKFEGHLKFEEEDKQARQAAKDGAAKEEAATNPDRPDRAEGEEEEADRRLPELTNGEALRLEKLDPQQKFTQPPPRFNEASLVKTLEEKGIGRPSTYASIINTIQDRDYVKKIQAKFVPTEIGTVVTKLLVKNFPYIFDTAYTATLEGELDAVEDGAEKWTDLLEWVLRPLRKRAYCRRQEHGRHQADGGEDGRDLRQLRQSADSEVGQVWELLLLQQLLKGQADDDCSRAVEERPEGRDQEEGYDSVHCSRSLVKSTTDDEFAYSK